MYYIVFKENYREACLYGNNFILIQLWNVSLYTRDNWGRKWSHVVAIDAMYFRDPSSQYNMKYVKRELNKAFAGFYTRRQTSDHAFPVATGNWGCGAFNGDKEFKGN